MPRGGKKGCVESHLRRTRLSETIPAIGPLCTLGHSASALPDEGVASENERGARPASGARHARPSRAPGWALARLFQPLKRDPLTEGGWEIPGPSLRQNGLPQMEGRSPPPNSMKPNPGGGSTHLNK